MGEPHAPEPSGPPRGRGGPDPGTTADGEVVDTAHLAAAQPDADSWVGRLRRRLTAYQDRPVVAFVTAMMDVDRQSVGSVVGSAIAFRLFLFFIPLLLFLVGLAGIFSGHIDPGSVSHDAGVSGSLETQIRSAFAQSDGRAWLTLGLGLFGMATAGRSLSRALIAASYRAWGMPVVSKASWRVVGAVAGLVAGMGLVSILINRIRQAVGLGPATLSFLPAVAIYGLAWFAISLLLPRRTEDPGAVLPGSLVVAVTIACLQAGSQFYLPSKFDRAGQLYGTLGSTVVTLGWFFILGRVIVLALELNPVVFDRYGSITAAVFSLPVVRILPRHSPRLRRLFDLDEQG